MRIRVPVVKPRRRLKPDVVKRMRKRDRDTEWFESDQAFFANNRLAAIWFLEHRDVIAAALKKTISDADLATLMYGDRP